MKAAAKFFCGSAVDDFGLTPSQFRVLFHLSRRAGKSGIAKCGIRGIATVCDMDTERVVRTIRDLENQNIVKCEREPKRTTRYYIQPFKEWGNLYGKSEQINNRNCTEIPNRVYGNTAQICTEIPNERYSSSTLKDKRSRAAARSSPEFLQLPADLQTNPELKTAWNAWIKHRSEIRKKLTPQTAQQQIEKIRQWGPDRAIAALRHSIAGGYQGIFEPNNNQKPKPVRPVDEFGMPKL